VVAESVGVPGLPTLSGYENHQGNAALGPGARPLGRVTRGVGNGDGSTEGAVQGNVVATYLHGPVLVRNPALADHLLGQVTGPLDAVPDEAVERLRRERIEAAMSGRADELNSGILDKLRGVWGRMASARGA
jgi:CobQ-like glutamine amidotransferase family enzyme